MSNTKAKCLGAGTNEALQENTETEAPIVVQQPADDKRIATLKAALALKGHAVFGATSGGYIVTRWNESKFCEDVDALERFALKVGEIKP